MGSEVKGGRDVRGPSVRPGWPEKTDESCRPSAAPPPRTIN